MLKTFDFADLHGMDLQIHTSIVCEDNGWTQCVFGLDKKTGKVYLLSMQTGKQDPKKPACQRHARSVNV